MKFGRSKILFLVLFFIPSCFNSDQAAQDIAEESFDYSQSTYPFELKPLTFSYDALEPHLDAATMFIHHNKHFQAYINNLNGVLKQNESLQQTTLKDLITNLDTLPQEVVSDIIDQGGGVFNHAMFWTMLSPNGGGAPQGDFLAAIEANFESFDNFKALFSREAKKLFGSGWVWLCVDENGKLSIVGLPNQNNPLSGGLTPIMCLDVWEHAYYLKYQNRRPDYISSWWNVVNWPEIELRYAQAIA